MVELMVVVQIRVADLEIQEVVVRHVMVEMDLKGPMVNCPSLTYKGYLMTFVVEEVLEGFRGSRKLKPGALSLYMGNGQRAAVEAIGSYDLCFPSGLVIVLHNCHYPSSIARGVISVSHLYDDGFINHFDYDNSISVSRNNLVYFSVVPKDGIYEIDSSNSNTNDRSMYVISNKMDFLIQDRELATSSPSLMTLVGCDALVKRDTLTKPDKLETRFSKCIFVGYLKETMGYSFYYPPENKVFVARNVEFFKNSLITQEACGSLEDLELIQKQDTHPSKNTSSYHDEDNQEIDEP
uniref:Retroviral polymerase SH3-like domain-containing protein n=1 Tax=Tanacetum cinerariifolium TaxID=118510 RepID=A0A6L2KDF0_TANCI|nr:hypothetical protein [Tanacetum cinerariifolium]